MYVAYRITSIDGRDVSREVDGSSIRVGRDSSCEIALDETDYPMVSGLHARLEARDGGFVVVHESCSNKTLINDTVVDKFRRVQTGDRLKLGFTGPTIEFVAIQPARQSRSRPAAESSHTIQADPRHLALLRGTLGAQRMAIGKGGVMGRDRGCQFPLAHPHVSRRHAKVMVRQGEVVLADLGSSNGTFVNGQRLAKAVSLAPGDRIDVGPFSLRFDGTDLVSQSRSNNVELSALDLKRVVVDRSTGRPLTLLDGVSLVVRPREFVCILGPSGSGKSTLLAMLSGRNAPDGGSVSINGEDLYGTFEALKADIAVVPQKDLLHDTLQVRAALRYTARLRLPPDSSAAEIDSLVGDIVEAVGLTERQATIIRYLSGGQIKRASLANELISRPTLLFLDEATSGLDEQTDREVMSLFRQVAEGGKTVVCITHSLANVESACHLVVILTRGGRLAFIGTPEEARQYFGISRLGDVYAKLEEHDPLEWHHRFRRSPHFERYISERTLSENAAPTAGRSEARPRVRRPSFFGQWDVLTRRYVAILRGDSQALIAMAGQGLLIAFLLCLVFGRLADLTDPVQHAQRSASLLLLLGMSCFWFGSNASAKELVKERAIFRREHQINLRIGPYLLSKLIVLAAIGSVQTALLWTIVQGWCRLPGAVAWQLLTLEILTVAGSAIGLLISAVSRSGAVATALVPIVIIPQIILAGVIAPVTGWARVLARGYVTVYWAQDALERLLPEVDRVLLGQTNTGIAIPVAVVAAHAAVAALAALIVLTRSGKQASSP